MMTKMAYSTTKSKELYEQAQKVLMGGMGSSFHKAPWDEHPIYMDHAEGARIYDVDGNFYIDYLSAFGPNIIGFKNEAQMAAVTAQIHKGTLMSAPNEDLVELCTRLVEYVPCAEKVYGFMNSGSEANMNAFRIARAYTKKQKIVKIEGCYHGSTDEEKVSIEAKEIELLGDREHPNKIKHLNGQVEPDNLIIAHYNDLAFIERIFQEEGHNIAGLILEAVMANAEPVYPAPGFLEGLRELCTKYNVILIFDEVITGFRLRLGGAQEYFGVTPDLACFGKAIANGYPISCVVGREEVLAAASPCSGTFAANALCVSAALATMKEVSKPGFHAELEAKSNQLLDGIKASCDKYGILCYTRAVGGLWTMVFGTDEPLVDYRDHYKKVDKVTYRKFVKYCMGHGIRLNPWRGRNYVNQATSSEDIAYSLQVFDEALGKITRNEL